jgi:nucleoside phosphorylase
MLGIVFATRREAQPFLSMSMAKQRTERPLPLLQPTIASRMDSIVVISGMGKVAATLAAAHLVVAYRVSALLNAGLCGRLTGNDGLAIGDLLRISSAVEGDCDRFGLSEPAVVCDNRWFKAFRAARLVTCDRPVFDRERRVRLASIAELADMEGAAVARVAQRYRIPCAMLKGISDHANETGRKDVARCIDTVAARIANALVDELALITTEETS